MTKAAEEEEAGDEGEALLFAVHTKPGATSRKRMTGAGARRSTFFSFVCGYF